MNSGRFILAVLAVCAFLVGCGTDSFDERARVLIDQVPSGAGDVLIDDRNGCAEVTEEDEYGIDVTYLYCGEDLPAVEQPSQHLGEQTGSMSLAAWAESEHARQYQAFLRRELILGGGCDVSASDLDAAVAALAPLSAGSTASALSATVTALEGIAPSCSSAEAWLPRYKQAVIAMAAGGAQVASANGLPVSTAEEVADILQTADAQTTLRAASNVYTNIAWILDGGPPDSTAHDDLWWDYSHLAAARLARTKVEIAVVGDSQAQFGLDPYQIEQRTGRVTRNFALPGLDPPSERSWLDGFVIPNYAPEMVVIAVSVTSFVAVNEASCTIDQIGSILDAQAAALNLVPLNASTAPQEVFAGRGEAALPIQSPYQRAIESRFDENATFIGFPELDERARQTRLDARAGTAAQPYCPSRAAELVALAQHLESQRIEAVVALMPISDDLAVLWNDRPDSVLPQVEQALSEGGIGMIDLRVLRPDQMLDPVHANADGQAALSAELARAINQLAPS